MKDPQSLIIMNALKEADKEFEVFDLDDDTDFAKFIHHYIRVPGKFAPFLHVKNKGRYSW